jgi:hypothetical protein
MGFSNLTRQKKEIDLGVDSKRSEQGNENHQHVKKLIPDMFISNPYGWMPHNAGFGFMDLTPSILLLRQFWD